MSCRCPETGTVRPMAFQCLEAERTALERINARTGRGRACLDVRKHHQNQPWKV